MNTVLTMHLSLEDLKRLVMDAVRGALGEVKTPQEEELLSPSKAAKFLGVAKSTLYSYEDRGLITKYLLGDLPRFKKSELLEAFEKLEKGRAA